MTDAVRDALKKLYNEVEGMWSAFEFGIRAEISNTNYACVQLRLDEAKAALAAPQALAATPAKRPVAFRVPRTNPATAGQTLSENGWRLFSDEREAYESALELGVEYQGLYARDGSAATPAVGGERVQIAKIIDPDAKWGEVLITGSDDNNQILLALEKADAIIAAQPASPLRGRDLALLARIECAIITNDVAYKDMILQQVLVAYALDAPPPEQPATGLGLHGKSHDAADPLEPIAVASTSPAAVPVTEREGTIIEMLADKLAAAEAFYRKVHDINGDGHIHTGRAWDKMRRSGDAVRTYLHPTAPSKEPELPAADPVTGRETCIECGFGFAPCDEDCPNYQEPELPKARPMGQS